MEEKIIESINERLRVIVLLLLQSRRPGFKNPSLREQILTLKDFGLRPREIGSILGRSNTYIHKELFELRKVKRVKRSKHEKRKRRKK